MSYYHENYHHTLFDTYQDWYDNYVTNLNKEPSPTEKYMAKTFFDNWYIKENEDEKEKNRG